MDHSLPQVELWSIWKKSCNQHVWAQNCTNSVWLGIFRLPQNPWRIRRSCNYKSFPNYTFFLYKFSENFSHPLTIFPRVQFNYSSYFRVGKQLQRDQPVSDTEADIRPTCQCYPPSWPPPITVSVSARGLKPPKPRVACLTLASSPSSPISSPCRHSPLRWPPP
jgi:hypothetical protein